MPGRWIYAPLILLVALSGVLGGLSTANVVSRYALGFTGAAGTALVFAFCYQRGFTGKERWSTLGTTVGLAFYSIAAGVITPAAPFWPATVFNYEWFISSTGVPIQLVRGLLACFIAYSIWAIWQQKRISDVSSARYARDVRRQFIGTFGAIATILLSGWALTEYLGEIYKKNVETDSRGELDLLSSRLASELRISDSIVELLAGDVSVKALFAEGKLNRNLHPLDMAVHASGAKSGYIPWTVGEQFLQVPTAAKECHRTRPLLAPSRISIPPSPAISSHSTLRPGNCLYCDPSSSHGAR